MKIKAKVLSPLHIASGDTYQKDFNLITKDNKTYIFDEFKVMKYFIKNTLNKDYLKLVKEHQNLLIKNKIYKREIDSNFNKDINAFIDTNNKVYIPGSSIKGAIRTAILNYLYNTHNISKQNITHNFDKELINIFNKLMVRDALADFTTQIYKTYNLKKDKNQQKNRLKDIDSISNYIEAIKIDNSFSFEIIDKNSLNLAQICNSYYTPKLKEHINIWFCNKSFKNSMQEIIDNLNSNQFLLNIGKFAGAESKTIDKLRYIKNSHSKDKSKTSTFTFGSEIEVEDFTNSLFPFGWILCEIQDKKSNNITKGL